MDQSNSTFSLTCRFILRLEVKRAHLKIESFDLKGTPTSRFGFLPIQIFIQRFRQIRSDGNLWDWGPSLLFQIQRQHKLVHKLAGLLSTYVMNGIDLNIFECNGPDLTDYDLYMCEARAYRNIDKLLRVVWCRIILITLQFT